LTGTTFEFFRRRLGVSLLLLFEEWSYSPECSDYPLVQVPSVIKGDPLRMDVHYF